MTETLAVVHSLVRQGRRRLGGWQLRRTTVIGATPILVLSALKAAIYGHPSSEERAWVDRIEDLRARYEASDEPLVVEDFGSGRETAAQESNLTTRTLGRMTLSSKPPDWAYLLFRLVREFRPKTCVELGACVGVSASYQAAALELNGGAGRLVSLEGSSVLADWSSRTLRELGLDDRATIRVGRFSDTLSDTVQELAPLQWAFIDGHHDELATLQYMEQIMPTLATEAILVFDDIDWSVGMRRAWQQVVEDPRFCLTVDLRSVGLAVVSAETLPRQALSISHA